MRVRVPVVVLSADEVATMVEDPPVVPATKVAAVEGVAWLSVPAGLLTLVQTTVLGMPLATLAESAIDWPARTLLFWPSLVQGLVQARVTVSTGEFVLLKIELLPPPLTTGGVPEVPTGQVLSKGDSHCVPEAPEGRYEVKVRTS